MGAGWGFAGFYLFEEPDDAYAEEAEEREPAEDVDEGPERGLATELLVECGLGGIDGVRLSVGVSQELGHAAEGVLKLLASARDIVDDLILMDVGAAGEQGGGDGDANGASDVAHEVEETAGVADLFRVKRP